MISTNLTTVDNTILSNGIVNTATIRGVQSLVERRTAKNKKFGKLEIITPNVNPTAIDHDNGFDTAEPINIIAGFLLDTSGSMQGDKLNHAINTIKKIMEVLHSERNGKTIQRQPIHAWIYVITFNSVADLVIPFQEITEETMLTINRQLDSIIADGCTNYERAFRKQTEVIEDILKKINDPEYPEDPPHHQPSSVVGGRNTQQFHMIRLFETDGEITEGSKNIGLLYEMMRSTRRSAANASTDVTEITNGPRITFEDYVIGYGTNVDLGCLKELAAPYHSHSHSPHPSVAGGRNRQCSSLVTIINTEDMGFKAGEILFKLILRYGNNWEISVETSGDATVELFEYQTHQWSTKTEIHSMIYGEKRSLWIQYTPSSTGDLPPIQVNIKYENQFTGEKFTYQFEHELRSAIHLSPASENGVVVVDTAVTTEIPMMINGMIQIEIFKMFREIELDRYDRDTIVREAYKILRMLKSIMSISMISNSSYSAITCQTENLITDVKVIIGLTTIQDPRKMKMVIHDRRICSAEQEVFNSCATISRQYINNEEEYEEDAIRVINAAKTKYLATTTDHPDHPQAQLHEEEEFNDNLPSRLATTLMTPSYAPDDYLDSISGSYVNNAAAHGSEIRALCVRIAISRNKHEDTSVEELYQEMRRHHYGNGGYQYDTEEYAGGRDYRDDTLSSTPMNDVYTQYRMAMMRHVSS